VTEATRPLARSGLSAVEATRRLSADGPNVLPVAKAPPAWRLLAGQLTHFFAAMLWAAAAIAALAGLPQLAAAIVVVVLLNGAFAFAQEYRADRAAHRLQDLMPATVTVRRDGVRRRLPAAELVRGDLVLLEAGDRVCADVRVEESLALALDESMLTGESTLVRKTAGDLGYAGTLVVGGAGEATVTATAGGTRLASISELTAAAARPPSPLSIQLHSVVRVIAVVAVLVGGAFFAVTLLLGTAGHEAFVFALGVTVALVPEGLLPTVTLSLAHAAEKMADRNALVRRLEAVETLGATTFICTDKTGTLTRNEMTVVELWSQSGVTRVEGTGYEPSGRLLDESGEPLTAYSARRREAVALAESASLSSTGHIAGKKQGWVAVGDPLEAALHVLACRAGAEVDPSTTIMDRRHPFDPRRRRSSAVHGGQLHVKGAPGAVLPRCTSGEVTEAEAAAARMTEHGLRVIAVACRPWSDTGRDTTADEDENDLRLLGVVGLEDPPRAEAAGALVSCRRASIKVAMLTGDHPGTARAVADELGLRLPDSPVLVGAELPADDEELARLLDRDGVVVARMDPADKLRVARALQGIGHVVAMTGDGVNDAPALRTADIGVAMGRSGTDVAREAADIVLLDDRFNTIVAAIEQGRATFLNIRRFLTYHLTDNVAELTPFLVWALTTGNVPLALGVLQILALDIGTDLLPALALGATPANPRTMVGPAPTGRLVDRRVVGRAFGVLGPTEAAMSMLAFLVVLQSGGWDWGVEPSDALLAQASGAAFAAVVLGQLANTFACRSETHWAGFRRHQPHPLLAWAVLFELAVLALFLLPPLDSVLGQALPTALGWAVAVAAVPAVVAADALAKALSRRRAHLGAGPAGTRRSSA